MLLKMKFWNSIRILILLGTVTVILADSLHQVNQVMLDVSKPITHEVPRIRAVCGSFQSKTPIYLQLWSPTDEANKWKLEWQVLLTPHYGDRSEEVISLNQDYYSLMIHPEFRLAIINQRIPGPMTGVTHPNASILLSRATLDMMTLPLETSVVMEFDSFGLYYDFALIVCSFKDCSDYSQDDSCTRREPNIRSATMSSPGFQLLSEDMVLGLIIWNITLTFVAVCTLITIVCMCNTLQKRKKEVRRFNKYRNLEIASMGTMSTKADEVTFTRRRTEDVAQTSTSRDSWVSTDGDRKKLHGNDALEY